MAIAMAGVLAFAAVLAFAITWWSRDAGVARDEVALPSIVVGTPAGFVLNRASPTATAPQPTVTATPVPTPRDTPVETATPAAVALGPTPVPPPPRTPAPTSIVTSAAEPVDAVTAFYGAVAAGDFDRAYALWSDRMKAEYPRQENLDERFAETASVEFTELFVASRTATTATVQANFVETYDSGATRQFVGYWQLVLVEGRWLLDHPTY